MGGEKTEKVKKHICIGLLAHVDAGKTTLSEAILYESRSIRKLGRVDRRDAFLDNDPIERERGITIFAKQAQFELGDFSATLLDTPGHADFSAEAERVLQVLDYAVLVISGADGVQGHTETLWRLLARYQVPVFLFINKMDQPGPDRDKLLLELQAKLSEHCLDFTELEEVSGDCAEAGTEARQVSDIHGSDRSSAGRSRNGGSAKGAAAPVISYPVPFMEAAAMCDEALLEQYLETGEVTRADLQQLIRERKLFPCFFGSALRLDGVNRLLSGLSDYALSPRYSDRFGAKVYKIARDAQGNRLSFLKVTGGVLKVRQQIGEEKIDQIRIYAGADFETVSEAEAGTVCAVTGLSATRPGMGLGAEIDSERPVLEPVLSYRIVLPEGCDVHEAWLKLRLLEDEDPELRIVWEEQLGEIHAKLMGEVQTEVLQQRIAERFGLQVSFAEGRIVYRETIARAAEGIGHYEPLRHYAEVHLLLEPLPRGSGLVFCTECSGDMLAGNWQRLVLSHLAEREYPGVLTGAPLTDLKITLVAGRAHEKHTEGGDFRQATYRAVRQGLMETESLLLEPYYEFRLELPQETVGRALSDLSRMGAEAGAPETDGEIVRIAGRAPVSEMRGYQRELIAYTRGRGRIALVPGGYAVCHDMEAAVAAAGYDPERDTENPAGSVFCAHGAGVYVDWREVPAQAHVQSGIKILQDGTVLRPGERRQLETGGGTWLGDGADGSGTGGAAGSQRLGVETFGTPGQANAHAGAAGSPAAGQISGKSAAGGRAAAGEAAAGSRSGGSFAEDQELEAIFYRTFGSNSRTAEKNLQRKPGRGLFDKAPGVNTAGGADEKRRGSAASALGPDSAPAENWLLVDGYNIIHAWDELRELSEVSFDAGRTRLLEILSNYQGYKNCRVIVVFDAYKVAGRVKSEVETWHNIFVVYTKQAETADQYIAKTVQEIKGRYNVTVATSDQLVQLIILGQGALRISARELWEEVEAVNAQLRQNYLNKSSMGKNDLLRGPITELQRTKD